MTFQVGDWVRRKKGAPPWGGGAHHQQVEAVSCEGMLAFEQSQCWWEPEEFELVNPFDPNALGMALQLAEELERETGVFSCNYLGHRPNGEVVTISDWLRSEVQRELLSQETPRGGE